MLSSAWLAVRLPAFFGVFLCMVDRVLQILDAQVGDVVGVDPVSDPGDLAAGGYLWLLWRV